MNLLKNHKVRKNTNMVAKSNLSSPAYCGNSFLGNPSPDTPIFWDIHLQPHVFLGPPLGPKIWNYKNAHISPLKNIFLKFKSFYSPNIWQESWSINKLLFNDRPLLYLFWSIMNFYKSSSSSSKTVSQKIEIVLDTYRPHLEIGEQLNFDILFSAVS